MAMIEFVRNYSDHSTDRGYQFEFRCDHCGNGYMSSYETSIVGTAGGLLQAAGNLFGGILGNVGRTTYDIQRAIGGPAHDRALQQAVAEVKQKFHQCKRCGNWVCQDICWNASAEQCTGCTPKYEQEVISMRTQAQIQATQAQLQEKAHGVDYVSGIDMKPDVQLRFDPGSAHVDRSPLPGAEADKKLVSGSAHGFLPETMQGAAACTSCGATLSGSRFCADCGAAVAPVAKTCSGCGHVSAAGAKFCEDCGQKL